MKKIIKYTGILLLIFVLAFAVLIGIATINDYQPSEKELVYKSAEHQSFQDTDTLNLLIWNIGYAGLDKEMDFFYDGGKKTRTTKEQLKENLQNIGDFLSQQDSIDFILLQEVDIDSKRSYYTMQVDTLQNFLPSYLPLTATNYLVSFVPLPFYDPMGKVNGGLTTFTKHKPATSYRHSFPGNYAWPKSLFLLDRCFLVTRFPVGDNELLIVNTHNSAYDDGSLRQEQMEYLSEFLLQEYALGNYIIVGGDWNQSPAGFQPSYQNYLFDSINLLYLPDNYLPEWEWMYDSASPTNRRLQTSFSQETSLTTIIDFYLVSPNVKPLSINTLSRNFSNSDHEPVAAKVKLIKKP